MPDEQQLGYLRTVTTRQLIREAHDRICQRRKDAQSMLESSVNRHKLLCEQIEDVQERIRALQLQIDDLDNAVRKLASVEGQEGI